MKLFRKLFLFFSLGILICTVGFFTFFLCVTRHVQLDFQKLLLPDTQISIYDKDGEKLLTSTSFETRSIVPLSALPSYLPNAFINTEDKRFYRHNGFDAIGMCRAITKNLKSRSFKEGASTISQQLIKNTHLTHEKTIRRKLQEIRLTKQLERKYSKETILETYLNTIYFGHSCYGIASAAEFYFGKRAEELTIAESALLAGLVKSPNNYSPFKSQEKAYQRRKVVLDLMKSQNSISENDYKVALDAYLPTTYNKKTAHSYSDYCMQEMDKIFEENNVRANGKIELFTHFSKSAQALLEKEAATQKSDKTLILVNNQCSGIEAVVSTVGKIQRQPGSLIKPLLIYAPAFEEGILSPISPVLDEPTSFSGYSPSNYNDEYHGYVSARTAIAKSLNIPAVKTLNTLGFDKISIYANKLQLPIPDEDMNLSFALGGMARGYSLQDIVDGYACLANDGFFQPSSCIKEVKINNISIYKSKQEKRNAFSPESAYLTTSTLQTAVQEGTAKKLRDLPFDVAAKTGTVGSKAGNTDAYTIAYTTKHTLGVWLGFADNSIIDTTGGKLPCAISKNILEELYKESQPTPFEHPCNVKSYDIDRYTYNTEHRLLLADSQMPLAYKQSDIFWNQYAPKEFSKLFLSPSIQTPQLSIHNNAVTISFSSPPPDFYHYDVIRTCDGKDITVYSGKGFPAFCDKDLCENKTYHYTIIPSYNGAIGIAIHLPPVHIKTVETTPPILDKPWWSE